MDASLTTARTWCPHQAPPAVGSPSAQAQILPSCLHPPSSVSGSWRGAEALARKGPVPTPVEAHPPKGNRPLTAAPRPSQNQGNQWGLPHRAQAGGPQPSPLAPGRDFWGCVFHPPCCSISWNRSSWGGREMGRKLVCVFSNSASPFCPAGLISPSLLFLTLQL